MKKRRISLYLSLALVLPACQSLRLETPSKEASLSFRVSEGVLDLQTKGTDAPGTLTLISEEGRTLHLIAVEEALPMRLAAATKAPKVYGSADAQALDFAAWAYNMQGAAAPSAWELDPGTGNTPVQVKYSSSSASWLPLTEVPFNVSRTGYSARWFALGPWNASQDAALSITLADGAAPALTYTVPSGKVVGSRHWDLLAAASETRAVTVVTPVALQFHHVLTGIRFKRDAGLDISNLKISGVYDKATLDMTKLPPGAATDLWSGRTKMGGVFEMDMAEGDWVENVASKDADILMMIPQWTPEGAKISAVIDGVTYTGDISGHRWLPGRLVTYRIDED
ncbi:MAG: fimbrillin family protein [Bacteroidales bacterium]|nr:fimbrillin family protein [Bacteroidales bacterium]